MASQKGPGLDLRPGPFFKAAANRLDLRSRKGFPVTVAWTIAGVSFLSFLLVAEDVVGPVTLAMDRAAAAFCVSIVSPALTRILWLITLMGDFRMVVVETAIAAVLLVAWGHPRRAGSVVILVSTGALIVEWLKALINRPRPDVAIRMMATPTGASFPSGHAMAGLLLFGTLALMLLASRLPKQVRVWGAIGSTLVGIAIGLSRVYLGVHYMSDVLGSWLLGTTMLATWAAAVLVWGRTQPPAEERVIHPWGRLWWRWALVGLGGAIFVVALVIETGRMPLP